MDTDPRSSLETGPGRGEKPPELDPTALLRLRPVVDTFQTLCVAPSPQVREVLEELRRLPVAG
jgi:hypothetical protein